MRRVAQRTTQVTPLKGTTDRYGSLAAFLHPASALLIIAMLCSGSAFAQKNVGRLVRPVRI